ncbi:MAG TPA: hypothetical protein VMZ71_01020, partial [Gemmataceae bacterium]|nr:hypothetical protein [Gemmataceae bacterium]
RPFKKLEYYAWYVASADGKVVAMTDGHSVRLLDAKGEPLLPGVARSAPDPAERIDFSADGRRMIATGGRSVQVWDLPNGRPLASAAVPPSEDYSGPPRIALSTDGRWAITSSPYDVKVIVRDAETGKVAGAGAKDENRMLAGFDGPGRVWSRNHLTGDLVSHALPDGPAGRKVTPPAKYGFPLSSSDGRWLVMSGARHSLSIFDTRADAGWVELESYRNEPMPACGRVPPGCAVPLRFSPDGRFLVTWWRGFCLWYLGERTPRVTPLTTVRDQNWWYPDAVFSHDGRRLAAVVREKGAPGSVRVWETASGAEAFRFDPPGGATGCGLTPDGKRLVVAHPDTTFSVWDFPAVESRGVRPGGHSWDRLGNREASVGLGAVHALVADPDAVAHLKAWFAPPDAATVTRLVADLDADDFATREEASKGLAALGEHAEGALREAVAKSPLAEVRRRAGRLLDAITGPGSVARLRAVRAAEALERIGTPAARELLSQWVKNYNGAALAAEAATALARFVQR